MQRYSMIKKLIFAVVIILFLFFLISTSYSKLTLFEKKNDAFRALEKKVANQYSQVNLEFSFLVKDLIFPDFELSFQENKKFPAASVVKLAERRTGADDARHG